MNLYNKTENLNGIKICISFDKKKIEKLQSNEYLYF